MVKPLEPEFTALVKRYLPAEAKRLYAKYEVPVNYAFVCGVVGVAVNYLVYHLLLALVWEPIAFYFAVGVAAVSNYAFTRGSMCHIFFREAKA